MNLAAITKVYQGSDADATRALYARLDQLAPRGPIAAHLMRLSKSSGRAKVYRGRDGRGGPSYRSLAYEKKDWAIGELCRALRDDGEAAGITSWGWGLDPKAVGFENVLYVDVPGAGQVSFHTHSRRDGPDYPGRWDGAKDQAARRICRWVEAVLDGRELTNEGGIGHGVPAGTEGDAGEDAAREPVQPEGRQETLDL